MSNKYTCEEAERMTDEIIEQVGVDEIRNELARLNWEVIEAGSGHISVEQAAKQIGRLLGPVAERIPDKHIIREFREATIKKFMQKSR